MAKLVIWAGPHRTNNDATAHRPGDIIGVREDGTPNGTEEGLPRFVYLQFSGVPLDNPRVLALGERDEDGNLLLRRRRWFIRRADLPAPVKQKWAADPDNTLYVSVPTFTNPDAPEPDYTWSQVRPFFRNKRTNLDVPNGEGF